MKQRETGTGECWKMIRCGGANLAAQRGHSLLSAAWIPEMTVFKNSLIRLSSSLNLPAAFTQSPRSALTTLLYHSLVAPGERIDAARGRLHRQLEWLRRKYTPLSPVTAADHVRAGTLPPYSLVVTCDDAYKNLVDISDVFEDHGIPLAVFPCVGWAESGSPLSGSPTLSRVVDFVRWYTGPERSVDFGVNGTFLLGQKCVDRTIDSIIVASQTGGGDFAATAWDVLSKIPRETAKKSWACNWSELAELRQRGVLVGSHTVTHPRLAKCSNLRLDFELRESKRVLEARLGPCEMFSYPFGTPDVVSQRTTAAVMGAGYGCAFLTCQDFAPNHAVVHCLPRITIPDDNMVELGLFQALVQGGQIPLQRTKRLLLSGFRRCEEAVLVASALGEFAS